MKPEHEVVRATAHVGLAVTDLARMVEILEAFGYEVVARKEIAGQGSSNVLRAGGSAFDLLNPTVSGGQLDRFIARRGPGLHHVCLEVDDLDRALDVARRLDLPPAGPEIADADGRLVF